MKQLASTLGKKRDRRGATLLVSIAILTLLAIFSVVFVQLVNFERSASANYVDAVRARLVARAGVQRAISELQRIATLKHYTDTRAVFDLAPPFNPLPANERGDGWSFAYRHPRATGGDGFGRDLSLLLTTRPSFAAAPDATRQLFGVPLAYSGALSSSYGNRSIDVYKLKVIDAASQLNLNHPDPVSTRRMLKNLLRAASDLDVQWPDLTDAEADLMAEAVLDARPSTGFRSLTEVEAALGQFITGVAVLKNIVIPPGTVGLPTTHPQGINRWLYPDDDPANTGLSRRLALRDMLTVSSWVDESVIRPWNLNGHLPAAPGTYMDGDLPENQGQRDLPIMPRAPINLNSASVPVLTGALAELAGAGRFGSAGLSYASARQLATAIRDRASQGATGPFKTWVEFERWLDGTEHHGVAGLATWTPAGFQDTQYQDLNANGSKDTGEPDSVIAAGSAIKTAIDGRQQLIRDLVKAALNPNSMINKWGPQATHGGSHQTEFVLPRLIDKTDLIRHGTEACFDSMGVFEVTSLGMVLIDNEREPTSPGMLIVAEQTQQVIVRVFDVLRLTTQADFETNRAFMATGDFIEAFDRKWTYTAPGVNRPRYGPPAGQTVPRAAAPWGFEGWPGVTSYPVYSLHRDEQETNYALRPEYGAADWEGYLTLSNLLAVPVKPMDFVVCFARGYLDAFKVRSWWEPKDQNPLTGEPRVDGAGSTVVATRGAELSPGKGLTPLGPFEDLQNLAAPRGRVPVLAGEKSAEENPLDAVPFGPDNLTASPDFFFQGSSLTPHGVIIHPDRDQPSAPNKPCSLAYDGDNIDLIAGTSIRFWVMPTDDPFAGAVGGISTEVLFSFVGSRDGRDRDVGFEVVKEADTGLGTVAIYLRWISEPNLYNTDVTTGNRTPASPAGDGNNAGERLADGNWGGPLGNRAETSVDVTPRGATAPNPLEPEWTPGSWHWVVLNFGPQTRHPTTGQTAILQVDRKITNNLGTTVINMGVIQSGNPDGIYYGEVHAQTAGSTFPHVDGDRINDFQDAYYGPGTGRVTTAWRTDRLLGDWYHCDIQGSISTEDGTERFPDAVEWNPDAGGTGVGGYQIKTSVIPPGDPIFPEGSYDRRLTMEFFDRGTSPPTFDHPGTMIPSTTGGMGNTGWTYNFTTGDMGPDGVGGTGDDFQIDIVADWKEAAVSGGSCACCSDCGQHCNDPLTQYWGRNTRSNAPFGNKCYMKYKKPPPSDQYDPGIGHGGFTGFLTPDPIPMHYICDQCDGCEACDVDGPMFFGGAPSGGENYDSSGNLADVDPTTVARAVFDNIIIKNNKERRTDTAGSKAFEDRFFESSLATASAANDLNFGAVYRRGLLELQGFRARLGTLSWTSYPTTANNLDFEASIFRMPGGQPLTTTPSFSSTSSAFLNTQLGGAPHGTVYQTGTPARSIGYTFTGAPALNTTADPTAGAEPYPLEILVLNVELTKLLSTPTGVGAAAEREGDPDDPAGGSFIPQPLVETPVFEDVTLTLILESPQILYAEEGVEE